MLAAADRGRRSPGYAGHRRTDERAVGWGRRAILSAKRTLSEAVPAHRSPATNAYSRM